jgi:hypothetical protein
MEDLRTRTKCRTLTTKMADTLDDGSRPRRYKANKDVD